MSIVRFFRNLGSAVRKAKFRVLSKGRVKFGKNVLVERGVVVKCTDGGRIEIGSGAFLGRHAMIISQGGIVSVGGRTHISHGSTIVAKSAISIGNDGLVGEYVTIRDQDHEHDASKGFINQQGFRTTPVVIGDNVWLGAKATVLRGSQIGSGAVVGANALAKGQLRGGALYVGVPAKRVRQR